eukprot:TRINITY_DN1324_c3_g1_i1.p1 TRINITY_DN1324_c3_g1~~TRINITY_DN1324_c3_g1_i1.p1  ORF type:complete len:64 (+),score=2.39 TRINITY_DN1324_c3_g1_i1:259-450(+)
MTSFRDIMTSFRNISRIIWHSHNFLAPSSHLVFDSMKTNSQAIRKPLDHQIKNSHTHMEFSIG